MAIHGLISRQGSEGSASRPRADRLHLSLEVQGSTAQDDASILLIHNLSKTGLLLEMDSPLSAGEKLLVEVPHAGPVPATVVWTSGAFVGCRFARPLPQAALSAALLRNPIETAPSPAVIPAAGGLRETFAERLTRLRRARGLSRSQLAERAGVSRPSVWAWETGRAPPRRSNLTLIAEALEVSEDILLGMSEPPPAPSKVESAPDISNRSQALVHLIAQSRTQIASMAGTEPERVRITIEF